MSFLNQLSENDDYDDDVNKINNQIIKFIFLHNS